MFGDHIHINRWLLPFSWLYGLGVSVRNKLFDWKIIKSTEFDIPIINVGNLTVGGTGKTPHVEYLIKLLEGKYKTAVLSRGYKRKSSGYILASDKTRISEIGDEPWQMAQKFRETNIAVDADRRRGIEHLVHDSKTKDTQVIILDDAYQHRYVKAGENILLIDYHRITTRDELLPAGRLREQAKGSDRASKVIVTKCPRELKPVEFKLIEEELQLKPHQELYFTTFRYGKLKTLEGETVASLEEFGNVNILLITGIGNPKQMESDLRTYIPSLETMAFPDHHYYNNEDMEEIHKAFCKLPVPRYIITTEKDAGRLMPHYIYKEDKDSTLVLPIEVDFLRNEANIFNLNIINYVQQNLRNSSLA